jgi:hypothetical protein
VRAESTDALLGVIKTLWNHKGIIDIKANPRVEQVSTTRKRCTLLGFARAERGLLSGQSHKP